jgi:hypothetical protein
MQFASSVFKGRSIGRIIYDLAAAALATLNQE